MLKRAAIIIAVFALIGAALNFPLAMLCAKSRTKQPGVKATINVRAPQAAAYSWPVRGPHAGEWPEVSSYSEGRAFGYRYVQVGHAESDGTGSHAMQVEYMGWPLPCVRRVQMWWPWGDPAWASTEEPDPKPEVYWAGAVGNPVLLGVAVWLVLVLPIEVFLVMRRRRRLGRRACVACGYPAGKAAVCTECGANLPAELALPATG